VGFLANLAALSLGLVAVLRVVCACADIALRRGRAAALRDLKRCALGALPLLAGMVIFVIGFAHDPLWPDQDETPARRSARLAASRLADQVYVASAIVQAAGVGYLCTLAPSGVARVPADGRPVT
jgi:hypothetical protein